MAEIFQRDRGYRLIVGDYKTDQGVLIENLHITFEVSKSSDNKKKGNSASIEVYNLSKETLRRFETDFLGCEFYCGYTSEGNTLRRLLVGEIVQVSTRRQGADKVTQLMLGEGYVALTQQTLSNTVPDGKTVSDVIEEIRKTMPGVVRGIYSGLNINNVIPFGYPLTGTPKRALEELSAAYGLDYAVEQNTLTVTDSGGLSNKDKATAIVLSEKTGLVEIPYYSSPNIRKSKGETGRRQGLQFKALLNPDIVPGKIVHIISREITGYFKVTDTRHYGSYRDTDWYVECFCDIPQDKDFE
jgi:hypothetical protein